MCLRWPAKTTPSPAMRPWVASTPSGTCAASWRRPGSPSSSAPPLLALQDLYHGGDVLRLGVGRDGVRGRSDIAAIPPHHVDEPLHLVAHLLHCTVGEGPLGADAAEEAQLLAVAPLGFEDVDDFRLKRVEDVEPT